ncbi:DNA-binding protein [Roseibium sp.]|uniref:helix-turn-helix domain-containing protein n=1 Tax=Roseibium sp. TaxID=1936156 RepID=UPI0025E6B376|nr:DNA-binding protein [Roseibium sp.]
MEASEDTGIDLLWEVDEIAKVIGRTPRQTFHMLKKGELPAKKVGGRWVAERGELLRFFCSPNATDVNGGETM